MNLEDEMDMQELCNSINYDMLSIEDPKTYPKPLGESVGLKYSPDGGSCIFSEQDGDLESFSYTIQDCDCSDPKNYDFYDKGRF